MKPMLRRPMLRRPMLRHLLPRRPTILAIVLGLGLASPAAARDVAPDGTVDAPAAEGATASCTAHMLERGRPARADWPSRYRSGEISATVSVGFDLDGSGRAVNLRVLDSSHDGQFDALTLGMIERTRFVPDVVVEGCVEAITHTRSRRRPG